MTLLVRTEGKQYQSGYTLDMARLLACEPLQVEARDQTARDAEAALGLPPSLYFYIGHACPAFGSVVFVYDFDRLNPTVGSASDHDTGGLHAGYVHFEPALGDDERRQWSASAEHRWPITTLVQRANDFVDKYFDSFAAYCTGARAVTDDSAGRLLHPENERRAWSIEVRLEADQPLLDGLSLIGLSPAAFESLREAVIDDPTTYADWDALLQRKVVREFDSQSIHSEIESLISTGAIP
ncbi:MAG: hypothetical protein ABTQ32_09285 [Myxococcaceae bacterium]